jgi:hypothetical protein
MSYTIRDNQTISGYVTGHYEYPASENGGSGSITLDWEEDVEIQVTVEDDPFQNSVQDCKQNIDLLTASVVATEAAQLASKAQASKQIGAGMVKGFFNLIQSEINQQMVELSTALVPKLQEIKNLVDRCRGLQHQMEADYHRIRDRYIRLFNDLDRELKTRIQSLDRAAFSFRQISADPAGESARSAQVTTPMVSGRETQVVQTQLLIHAIRQSAMAIIQSAHKSITSGKRLSKNMSNIQEDVTIENRQMLLLPIVFAEYGETKEGKKIQIIFPERSPFEKELVARKQFIVNTLDKAADWMPLAPEAKSHLEDNLLQFIIKHSKDGSNKRCQREAEMAQKLWGQMKVSTLSGEMK